MFSMSRQIKFNGSPNHFKQLSQKYSIIKNIEKYLSSLPIIIFKVFLYFQGSRNMEAIPFNYFDEKNLFKQNP